MAATLTWLHPSVLILFFRSVITMAQLVAAILLYSRTLPLQEHTPVRVMMLTILCLAGIVVTTWTGGVIWPDLTSESYVSIMMQYLIFSSLLFACAAVVCLVWNASVWTALFCCTMGYTMQNIASSSSQFLLLLIKAAGWQIAETPLELVMTVFVTLVVYGIFQRLLISRIEEKGLVLIKDPAMLTMSVIVVFTVIGFDVGNKYLTLANISFEWIIFFRVIHGIVCVTTMLMEYQLLYVRQLQTAIAISNQLMADQERQWRLSRETVAAINAKSHAMRHHVLSLLCESTTHIDRELLRDIGRELDIYDTHIHSGNEALDIILTEKALLAQHAGITLCCVADGILLCGVAPADLHQLVSTALDDALKATGQVADTERRSIMFDVRSHAGMATIHLTGYRTDKPKYAPAFPKADINVMTQVVERYHGTLNVGETHADYRLDVLLPSTDA